MMIQWMMSAVALLLVSKIVPGFYVYGLMPAVIASAVIGFLNATLGAFLKIITFPLAIITFGVFLLVINAMMILLASKLVPGFQVQGYTPAFWGAAVLTLLSFVIRALVKET
jgi:putative membrane protein